MYIDDDADKRISDGYANGFKIRNSLTDYNQSGATYIYMCFAESPLGGTTVIIFFATFG